MCGFTAQAQVKVQGLVRLASDKEPIAGATVLIKGMNTGTVTDMEGHFSLTLPIISLQYTECFCAGRCFLRQIWIKFVRLTNLEYWME